MRTKLFEARAEMLTEDSCASYAKQALTFTLVYRFLTGK